MLSKKYGEEDFAPIKTNLTRISELINDAYRDLKDEADQVNSTYTPVDFINQMDSMVEAARDLFPVYIQNEVKDYRPGKQFHIELNPKLVFQVIENAIDNSCKARSTKIIIRLLETDSFSILELIDNGVEKATTMSSPVAVSIIPHGIGKEIMINNMIKANGRVEWSRRLDNSGMIVRLYFPKIAPK